MVQEVHKSDEHPGLYHKYGTRLDVLSLHLSLTRFTVSLEHILVSVQEQYVPELKLCSIYGLTI